MANDHLLRHARDLRDRAGSRADVEAGYRRAVDLASPIVVGVLEEMNRELLDSTGAVERRPVETRPDGGLEASWRLTWPAARDLAAKGEDEPAVVVSAWAGATSPHGHLTGNGGGLWPLAVDGEVDLEDLRATVAAIAEAGLHAHILELGWRVVPAAGRG